MLILTSTDSIRIVTDAAVTNVDVHASWVDRNGTTDTPGNTQTRITTATTTNNVVAAPAASTYRNIRHLRIRNSSAATTVTVTVILFNGTLSYELEKRAIGPGGALTFEDSIGFRLDNSTAAPQSRPWDGVLAGCLADGDPGRMMSQVQTVGSIAATPTNITTSIARCSAFMLSAPLTFNRIRAYGVGATTTTYRVAIYRMSDLARLTAELAFTTVANTWVSIGSALNITLAKDVLYFAAVAVNATGTTAGVACIGPTVAATTGQIATAPGSLPGSLLQGATNYLSGYQFQFAVTTGALPATAPALAAQAAWTGGMPAFWLDTSDT